MNPTELLSQWLSVAEKETRATLLSPRLLILALVLILAMTAGAYEVAPGMGIQPSPPSRLVYGVTYFPTLNLSDPAMAVLVATVEGKPSPGIEVDLLNTTDSGGTVTHSLLAHASTNTSGWARFERLRQAFPYQELVLSLADEPGSEYASASTQSEFPAPIQNVGVLNLRAFSFGASSEGLIVSLVFMDSRGTPSAGAGVFIRGRDVGVPPGSDPTATPLGGWARFQNGTTDANGYYYRQELLTTGQYVVRVDSGTVNATTTVAVTGGSSPFGAGPDGAMIFVGYLFVPLVVPLMALMLGYDAVAREKADGSLDLLLSKPISRHSVALGKLAGVLASVAAPVLLAYLGAAAVLWLRTGHTPTGYLVLALVAEAFYLILVYALIALAISALIKNPGTALLVSVLVYVLFTAFWDVVSYVVAGAVSPPGTLGWYHAVLATNLFSPDGVYLQLVSHFGFGLLGSLIGLGAIAGDAPMEWLLVSGTCWVMAPLALLLWTMKYRVSET